MVRSLAFHSLIRRLLPLLDSLPLLVLPGVWPFQVPRGLLFPAGIARVHRLAVAAWSIITIACTRTIRTTMNRTSGPIIVVVVRPAPILAPLFVGRGAIRTIRLPVVLRTLPIPPITTLVACSAIGWRIVRASCLSGGDAVFEVRGPSAGCDRRPTVVQ
jgi:hypothetical protein